MPVLEFATRLEQQVGEHVAHWGAADASRLFAEVETAIKLARVRPASALGHARIILETIVSAVYNRELPGARSEAPPLFDMIEKLGKQKELLSPHTSATMHLIRTQGNRAAHARPGKHVAVTTTQEIEAVILLTIGLIEWYLNDYLRLNVADTPPTVPAQEVPTDQQICQEWSEQDQGFRSWQIALGHSLTAWEEAKYDGKNLLTGQSLVDAEEWLAKERERLTERQTDYIEKSITQRAAEQHELGLALNQQATKSIIDRRYNAAYLYSLHSLARISTDCVERPSVVGRSLTVPIVPSIPLASHTETVTSIAFSPDGRRIASGSQDRTIRLWDVETGKISATLEGHSALVRSVAFSPDGEWLASGADDRRIRLWDAETGQFRNQLLGHLREVRSVSFSHDGQKIASGSNDGMIRRWNVAAVLSLSIQKGHPGSVACVSFASNGQQIAFGSLSNIIYLWDAKENRNIATLQGHSALVQSIAFSPNGEKIASGSDDKTIRLWEVKTGQSRELRGHALPVTSVAFSPDGTWLASGSRDNTIRLWDVATHRVIATLEGHSSCVRSVVFSHNGKWLASGSDDRTIRLWDTDQVIAILERRSWAVNSASSAPTNGARIAPGSDDGANCLRNVHAGQVVRTLKGHAKWVRSVAFSPDGAWLASGSQDNTIRLWDVRTGQFRELKGHSFPVTSVAFSPDGTWLASGSQDNMIRLWNVKTDQEKTLRWHSWPVTSVAFSPDGQSLVSGAKDRTIRLWDVETGQVRILGEHSSWVNSVAFSFDGRKIISGSGDRTIRLWDVETGGVHVLENHQDSVKSVAFSPDGTWLASGSRDNTILLWDVATHQVIATLKGHSSCVRSVVFSPNGKWIASGSDDKTIRLWDVATHRTVAILEGHSSCARSVVFSPNGEWLASGSGDETIRLWSLERLPFLINPIGAEQITREEKRLGLRLQDLEVVPIPFGEVGH